MSRPRLLETHGCQGIGHAGYIRAGWDVTAVDINRNHAKYHPGELIISDAATYIRDHGHEYDAIHASPPCQWYTRGNAPRRGAESKWERSIPPIREALESTGRPYVLENVLDAGWDMLDPTLICGCMFDLSTIDTDGIRIHLQRPRLFETNWPLAVPKRCEGEGRARREHPSHEWVAGAYGGARRDKYEARYVRHGGYVPPEKSTVMALLGITAEDRIGAEKFEPTWDGLFECLPPAYTEWVGAELMAHLEREVAA